MHEIFEAFVEMFGVIADPIPESKNDYCLLKVTKCWRKDKEKFEEFRVGDFTSSCPDHLNETCGGNDEAAAKEQLQSR
jgi:hypothetical protein